MDLIHLLKVLFLSFIQGVTEFFPVSSSGHLVLFQKILNFSEMQLIYDIFFHLGTLTAVVVFFFKDLKDLTLHFHRKENFHYITLIITASIPTALIGLIFRDQLESLFKKGNIVGIMFLVTAILLLLSKYLRFPRLNDHLAALIIGTFQGIAIIPGISRSGFTISVALILSMGYAFSFRFSFILSIPAIIGALILEFNDIPWGGDQPVFLITGMVFAALFGIFALGILKRIVLNEKFHYFAYYCIFLSLFTFIV